MVTYRCRYKGKGSKRFIVLLPRETDDARMLIWVCEKHLKMQWPVADAAYVGHTEIKRFENGKVATIDYEPPTGGRLEITRDGLPFRKGESIKGWIKAKGVLLH